MAYSELYILIEGDNDERFVEWVVKPILDNQYDYIGYYQYSQRPKRKIKQFVRSIRSRKASLLCLTDIDAHPCVTARKQTIKEKKFGRVDDKEIVVVKKVIEGWYLAGLSSERCRILKIPLFDNTDTMVKQKCEDLLYKSKLGCTISCKIEILKNYDFATAISKNKSFNYFYGKHLN